jgi:hypothetical protein
MAYGCSYYVLRQVAGGGSRWQRQLPVTAPAAIYYRAVYSTQCADIRGWPVAGLWQLAVLWPLALAIAMPNALCLCLCRYVLCSLCPAQLLSASCYFVLYVLCVIYVICAIWRQKPKGIRAWVVGCCATTGRLVRSLKSKPPGGLLALQKHQGLLLLHPPPLHTRTGLRHLRCCRAVAGVVSKQPHQ